MNFLSHYYFERNNPDHFMVMGVVLPDLVKNAHKDWNLHPQKDPKLYEGNTAYASILRGWQKHILVDNNFHSSEFFKMETAQLKKLILPAVTFGPVKPFFLAHIGLELLLDHLLLHANLLNIDTFYQQLQQSHNQELSNFLALSNLPDSEQFNKFLDEFIKSQYLFSYQKIENISYSLNRICMRLWNNPFSPAQLDLLTLKLDEYCGDLKLRFINIFDELEANPSIRAI
jgi:acyl carrier protein phosphodiesterase